MKKVFGSMFCLILVTLLCISTASASFDIRYTAYTYAKDTHPVVEYYEGFVGVRGADWIKQGMYWCWPKYSKISYKVPMTPLVSIQVTAGNSSDTDPKTGHIIVWDNPLPTIKTKSYYDIRLEKRPGNVTPDSFLPIR